MRVALLIGLVVVAAAAMLWTEGYNRRGLEYARAECRREGILRIIDQRRWRALVSDPVLLQSATRSSRDLRPDGRFHRTVTRMSLDGLPVAELNILRVYPVSVLSWTGLGTPSPAFICAWDVRRTQYSAALPFFF